MGAAAETMVGLPGGADNEAGRLLAVERAQALVINARLFQRDRATDKLNNVDAGEKILDEGAGNHPVSVERAP